MKKETFIIGIGGSDVDGVIFHRVNGTRQQVKNYLCSLVKKDRDNDPDDWDFGTTEPGKVEKAGNGYYAYGVYSSYHIDYSARPEAEVTVLELNDDEDVAPKTGPLRAVDIEWDVDMDEAYYLLDNMPEEEAAKVFNIHPAVYAKMSTEERHDYAYSCFHHNAVDIAEFVGLPNEVVLPEGLTDDEDIANYLSDQYGYCHRGFDLAQYIPKEARS